MEDRYILVDAAQKLSISKSTLLNWIARANLREAVNKQVMEGDLRAFYLTRAQLEQLAALHRRKIGESIGERVAALEQQVAVLTEKVEELIKKDNAPLE